MAGEYLRFKSCQENKFRLLDLPFVEVFLFELDHAANLLNYLDPIFQRHLEVK